MLALLIVRLTLHGLMFSMFQWGETLNAIKTLDQDPFHFVLLLLLSPTVKHSDVWTWILFILAEECVEFRCFDDVVHRMRLIP